MILNWTEEERCKERLIETDNTKLCAEGTNVLNRLHLGRYILIDYIYEG